MRSGPIAVICALMAALPLAALDVVTTSGQRYPDARITASNDAGVDVDYREADGSRMVAYLQFSDLPAELRRSYNYVPALAERFLAAAKERRRVDMEERLNRAVVGYVRDVQLGNQLESLPTREELLANIYANRRPVVVEGIRQLAMGSLVRVVRDTSNLAPLPENIVINREEIVPGNRIYGFIYPTGLTARVGRLSGIPVFCDNSSEAAQLAGNYLKIYREYAKFGRSEEFGGPDLDKLNAGDYNSIYPYSLGENYAPVAWWVRPEPSRVGVQTDPDWWYYPRNYRYDIIIPNWRPVRPPRPGIRPPWPGPRPWPGGQRPGPGPRPPRPDGGRPGR